MRRSLISTPLSLLLAILLSILPFSSAIRLIESKSLSPCQDNSNFTASLFNVVFTPDNRTLGFDVVGISSIAGNITAELRVIAYGFTALKQVLDPCRMADLKGFCPMNTGQIDLNSNIQVSEEVIKSIPALAYNVPDLDGTVRIYINNTDGVSVACVEAQLSNGKTVDQKAVSWITAVIAGLGLLASAISSGLGHSNTAAHVAANALSLFGYFQAQSITGMIAFPLPPIVQSWTMNFNWSMGIIKVRFMQRIFTWFQQSTGGTPSTLLSELSTTSVSIQKRSAEIVHKLMMRAYYQSIARSNKDNSINEVNRVVVVKGIKRVSFKSGIEVTNLFMTGLSFLIIFVVMVALGVAAFKGFCEAAVKFEWMKREKFLDFRENWKIVLKGIMYRLVIIGYPQMAVLCLWELTVIDSPAEVVLALFFFFSMTAILSWACWKVYQFAKRSIHKNPADILYSDNDTLNRWGFLYVQFKATAYWFIGPVLFYILIKAMFISFGQKNGTIQAVALVLIELAVLVAVSWYKPWMDKRTNIFNISICSINFLNAIFLLVFSNLFNQPKIVSGVMGVVFFVINAAFALVLLILVLISSIYAIVSKNPDVRYERMQDDRASFIKSQTQLALPTELNALGATARGDKDPRGYDEMGPLSPGAGSRKQFDAGVAHPPVSANSMHPPTNREPPHSPIDPSEPLVYGDSSHRGYGESRDPFLANRSATSSPSPYGRYKQSNNPSPWHVGAGYEQH
ncbi:hypothetical protein FGG08_003283 [Glutinoglossum americanum]|uniref:ML-like domain-containing protein n=1 Tax=Glutinoglossum americanum TaxID=1670608 RepID=A0A9P8I823_9PEZI|nr:hypothetical protein FGG08_003283 [Glutinoglossum americanum]